MPDDTLPIEGPPRLKLTGGKEVELRTELTMLENIQACGYAGKDPSAIVLNQVIQVCYIAKLKLPGGDLVDVFPLKSPILFAELCKKLSDADGVIIGAAVAARSLDAMSEEQKKDLAATLERSSGASLPTD